MKILTINDIRSYGPCYDPNKFLAETWQGTTVDILKDERIPPQDRLWVVLRTELVSEKVMRLFAVWCARQVVKPDADPRTLFALEFAESYAENYHLVDDQDYRDMWDSERSAALSAAWSAALSAAESAAWSAAESAAESAAWSAAESAARSAAESAARSAARSAAESAARSAAWSAARSAARSAALSAAWSAQISKLIEMINAGVETGDTVSEAAGVK